MSQHPSAGPASCWSRWVAGRRWPWSKPCGCRRTPGDTWSPAPPKSR